MDCASIVTLSSKSLMNGTSAGLNYEEQVLSCEDEAPMPVADGNQKENTRFNTTRWSVVLQAGFSESDQQRQAWNALAQTYWYPLYLYCRRQGSCDHDAQDLTQGFFAHLLDKMALKTVSPEKGRFRSFLLAAFRNYMANVHRAASTLQRGGDHLISTLKPADLQSKYALESNREETPEQAYERSWVLSLLNRVRVRLGEDYQRAGRSKIFEVLQPFLGVDQETPSREQAARLLNLSQAAVNMSIHRMRRRYGELLTEEVAGTVENASDVQDELRELMAIVQRSH